MTSTTAEHSSLPEAMKEEATPSSPSKHGVDSYLSDDQNSTAKRISSRHSLVSSRSTGNIMSTSTMHPTVENLSVHPPSLKLPNRLQTSAQVASPRHQFGKLQVFSSWVNQQMQSQLNVFSRNLNLMSYLKNKASEDETDQSHNATLNSQQPSAGSPSNGRKLDSFVNLLRPQKQQIFYAPADVTLEEEDEEISIVHEEDELDNPSVAEQVTLIPSSIPELTVPSGIQLHEDETILHIESPASSFRKNVIILFIIGIIATAIVCYLPLRFYEDEGETLKSFLIYRFVHFAVAIFFIFMIFYVLCYKLMYCKLLLTYVVTSKRLFICRGYYPLESFLQTQLSKLSSKILEREEPISFWSLKDEIEDIVFTLDIHSDKATLAKVDRNCVGSIYFGHRVERVFLPFSILTEIVNAGFVSIPNVYAMLDLIITQCQRVGNSSIQRARLINSSDDSALVPQVIEKRYALLGLPLSCCYDKPVGENRKLGKISPEDIHSITSLL